MFLPLIQVWLKATLVISNGIGFFLGSELGILVKPLCSLVVFLCCDQNLACRVVLWNFVPVEVKGFSKAGVGGGVFAK